MKGSLTIRSLARCRTSRCCNHFPEPQKGCGERVRHLKPSRGLLILVAASAAAFLSPSSLAQQMYTGGHQARPLVTQPIDEGKLMVLRGNTPAVANAKNDRGAVPDSMPVNELTLVLQRPPELEQALESRIDAMGRPGSPVYHKWLTAQQIGEQYGPSQQDVETTTQWLESQGFTLKGVLSSGMGIVFSGNAGQVKQAFHTELHYLDVNGQQQFANVSDPEIPAALAGLVVGVSKLNDFRPLPRPLPNLRPNVNPSWHSNPNSNQGPQPKFNETYDGRLLGPADVATIYNINPVHANGYTGAGQTIAVVGFSGLLHTTDITQFRSMFGLTGGSWTTVQVPGTYTCTDPGLTQLGYEEEAALDSEWAGAEAPGAAVELVACANLTAETEVQDIADLATPPKIITTSISDGCESQVGSAGLQFIVTVFQQAAAEGISIFDATSDSGADVCDQGLPAAVSGIQADSAASTPYDVAVGGLDFSDYYTASQGGAPESTYWSATNNSTTMGSALSYIPEMTWNSSCASELIYKEHGYTQSYGSTGFCNTATAADNYLQNTYAGGGAPSSFSKQPAWQSALGVPTADPASGSLSTNPRYLPDIAFFGGSAGDHAFAFCLTDNTGISSCSASSSVEGGGTSFTAPMMAGIQALINQAEGGGAQGNPNPIFYALAGTEYGSAGSSACNSSLGTSASSACIFYDITLGDKADILWRNSTSGDVYIWLMNGISIANQGGLGDITSD